MLFQNFIYYSFDCNFRMLTQVDSPHSSQCFHDIVDAHKEVGKNQLKPLWQPPAFWRYKTYNESQKNQIQNFIAQHNETLLDKVVGTASLEKNYEELCKVIGMAVHPCLQDRQREKDDYNFSTNRGDEVKHLQIANHKLDTLTIIVLGFLLRHYKINSLKLSRNQLSANQIQTLTTILKEIDLSILFFQWNNIDDIIYRNEFYLTNIGASLHSLILRENNLGDVIVNSILQKIRENSHKSFKAVDFSGNQLTAAIADQIQSFVINQKQIRLIELAKNKLGNLDFLQKLFEATNQRTMTLDLNCGSDDKTDKQDADKENTDKEKKQKQSSQNQLLKISLKKNKFSDEVGPLILGFAEGQSQNIKLYLEGNNFGWRWKNIFRQYGPINI